MARIAAAHIAAASSAAAEIETLGELLADRVGDDLALRMIAARLRLLGGAILSAVDGEPAEEIAARLA